MLSLYGETTTPETAVRNYLTFLSDPDSLRDPEEVRKLEDEVAKATDIVEQLMARAALRKAMMLDPDTYERAFIEVAREWADAQGVPGEVFEEMGVRSEVLEAAGFYGKRPRRAVGGPRKAAAPPGAPRRASVKSDALEAGILALGGPFSVRDVSERVGGSTITVTKAIERLEAQKKIVTAGERANERGRASRVWSVA